MVFHQVLQSRQKILVSTVSILTIIFLSISSVSALDSEKPEITYPENGARFTSGDTAPNITWTGNASATRYEIEFGLDPLFESVFSLYSDTVELDFDSLLGSAWDGLSIQLHLHVRALADDFPLTGWSDSIEFAKTVKSSPGILSPVDDARFVSGDMLPVFQWEEIDTISDYIIEFSLMSDFSQSLGSISISGSEVDCNANGSTEIWDIVSGTFYWRVAGMEKGLVPTPYSEISGFSKTIEPPTTLLSPPDKSRLGSAATMPVFTWEPLPNVSPEYHIQFAYGAGTFPAGGSYIEAIGTSFTFESIGITEIMWQQFYGKLKWRVAGIDSNGNHGGFSTAFSFTKLSNYNYMAYGDSITGGYGASDWGTDKAGYPRILQGLLQDRYGDSTNVACSMNLSWFPGAHAYTGNEKINAAMEYHGPGTVLIMFGIIDIVDPGASGCEENDCRTIENLAGIINKVRLYQATPYLATLPPINPVSDRAFLQEEVDELNVDIRNLGDSLSVPICELDNAFFDAPLPLEDYFNYDEEKEEVDWAHFNDAGYQIIAESWNEIL